MSISRQVLKLKLLPGLAAVTIYLRTKHDGRRRTLQRKERENREEGELHFNGSGLQV